MINTKKANAKGTGLSELQWECAAKTNARMIGHQQITCVSVSITTINCLLESRLAKTCTVIPQSRRLSLFWGSLE